jgi:hypothetical protein
VGDDEADTGEGDAGEGELRRTGPYAVAQPADELGDDRGGGGEEGDVLRAGDAEGEVGEQVERREPEDAPSSSRPCA